jgi:succinate dehydrogenase/fumarate reductase cytochrome b subunit
MKINIKFFIANLSAMIIFVPASIALAASPNNFSELVNLLITGIIKPIVPFLVGLAVVVFLYGVVLLMFSEGGEKKEEGKQYMLWGIIGIFVMVSVWGLVAILGNAFQLNNTPQMIKLTVPGA